MISSNQLIISGGQISQYNYHGQKAPFDKLTDAIAPNAFHDSAARFDPPKCHPRTRVRILDDIMDWILGQGQDTPVKPFLWLNGAAGAGKSAIAQSTIERCIERGIRLASFFFSNSDSTRNHAKHLVATLAYQLYQAFPGTEVQTEILSAISKEPLIFTKQIQQQFTTLVVQPLKTYLSRHKFPESQTSFLIVIDGLDECIDRASQTAILSSLVDSVRDFSSYMRILVASRPEYDIRLSFDAKHLKDIHTRLSLDLDRVSDAIPDIKLYLSDQFEHIKDDCNSDPVFWPKLGQSWPGEKAIEKLAWRSSGQFIYATTVIRFVTSARPRRPDHRLDMVLELRPHDGDHPFAELDALYEKILESCKNVEKVLAALSFSIINDNDISWDTLLYENILSYQEGELWGLFCDIGALVTFREHPGSTRPEDMYLSILHASFRDYLKDKARSKKFHIDIHGKYFGRHMTNLLKCLALCSPNYDPDNWGDFDSPLASRAATFFGNYYSEIRRSTIPPELSQAAFSFPLKEFLAPHFLSSEIPYHALEFLISFLHFLRIMVLKDPTCSYIEDHHQRNLDAVMIHPLQRYFDKEALALILAVFHHLGADRFVPLFILYPPFDLEPHEKFPVPYDIDDSLRLSDLFSCTIEEKPTPVEEMYTYSYYDYMHRFLMRGAAPNPAVYAKAVKVCFDFLRYLPVPSSASAWGHNGITDNSEDDPCPNLVFEEEYSARPWVYRSPWSDWRLEEGTIGYTVSDPFDYDLDYDSEHDPKSTRVMYFTVLGYIIFFLPGCDRSDDLIAACIKQQRSYIENPNNPFPVRWRRLHMEINNYLARVLLTSNV
ncbi:hypothetical protein D9613_008180 [Agrocybe pediades]|uniref:Nephrocystin 3-like N-terminal domain-containing protein n=1 Tax=Agrocybe pediades TaxID=84607 RepID=A0A8H4QM07_9AGAR|nr:hypothetical protein D9613_008180 [Agrocybe pediades]